MHYLKGIVFLPQITLEANCFIDQHVRRVYFRVFTGYSRNNNVRCNNIIIAQHGCKLSVRRYDFCEVCEVLVLHETRRLDYVVVAKVNNAPFSWTEMLKFRECPLEELADQSLEHRAGGLSRELATDFCT